jgi:hypothetical protein
MSNRFHVAKADLDSMVEIARVSSYEPDKKAWTELALYYRGAAASRPWVPVVEGLTDALDMSDRFQAAMMGTVERAMAWFEASNLRDRLSEKVEAFLNDRRAPIDKALKDAIEPVAVARPLIAIRVVGITASCFGEVLAWLYPDAPSDAARTAMLETDFGMPARTARRALQIEAGTATGEPGAWVNMFMVAMRFFDRELWIAGGCSATIARVEG